jgi:hypothetical protein
MDKFDKRWEDPEYVKLVQENMERSFFRVSYLMRGLEPPPWPPKEKAP